MRRETITSAQNPKIKMLLALGEKSRTRRENALFIVEGRLEIMHCIEADYKAKALFACTDIISGRELDDIAGLCGEHCTLYDVSRPVYEKIAYRSGTEGVIAEVEIIEKTLKDVRLRENPLVVVLESVEKPGNLGAVLRTADAADADAVVVCDPLTDLYNPNLIRASLGSIFTRQVVSATSGETLKWLKDNNIKIYTAQLQDSSWYYDTDMKCGTALVMGTEHDGLSTFWRMHADAHVKIPMLGSMDSLNVSVSSAILMFEAVRQRHSCRQVNGPVRKNQGITHERTEK